MTASSDPTMHWRCNNIPLSALGGGEGRGEAGEAPAPKGGAAHLTLPPFTAGPSLSPLKGGEGDSGFNAGRYR